MTLAGLAHPLFDRLPPVAPAGSIKAPSLVVSVGDTPNSLLWGIVPGASEEARRVEILNANWVAGGDGEDGQFELMIVTENGERHFAKPSASAMGVLVALAEADIVLVWDPDDRRLIAANLRGTMPWTEQSS